MSTLAAEHYRAQVRRARAAALLAAREWAQIGADFEAGWRRVGPRLSLVVASAQAGSAADGADFVAASLAAQGTPVKPDVAVNARALAGVASDGRDLQQLLYGAVVRARSAKVDTLAQRLELGRQWLDMAVQTQVADAGRDAAKVAITTRPRVQWVRVVSPPCCGRCAILSGHVYKFSQGFQRHPHCDCTMLPQTVADPFAAGRAIDYRDVTDLTRRQKLELAASTESDPSKALARVVNDHARKRGAFSGYLPPTRVDKVIVRAGQREKALDALRAIGVVI